MKLELLFKKKIYRYWLYKIKRKKPWDYFFFDWLTFLIIVVIFLAGLLIFFPHKIIINIPAKNTQVYILESILRNISLFIGISFSFILLSFNIFYRYFGRFAFLDFFKTKSAKICLTLLVCAITLLIYSTAYIRDLEEINNFDKFLYTFSIVLSIISFFSVFPCLLILLRNSQNRENIKRLFQRLNENWVIEEFQARVINKSLHQFYHKDPVSILTEIGLSAIKEFDNKTILVITRNCPEFFESNLKLVAEEKSRIDNFKLYDAFRTLLSSLFQLSVKERNEVSSMMILNSRFKLEKHVLKNLKTKGFEDFIDHESLYRHWDLNFDVTDFFNRAIQFNEDEVCKKIIDNYRDFNSEAIPVLFPKNFKYTKEQHFSAAREADMVFDPLRTINDLVPIINNNKKNLIFQSIFTLYTTIEQSILKLETSNEVKCFILNIVYNYKYDVFNRYSDLQDVQHISYLNFPFNWAVNTFKDIGCTTSYFGLLQVINLLFAKNKLNVVVINGLKAEMFQLIELLNEKPAAKSLLLKSINKFRDLAGKISQTDIDYRKDIYLQLEKHLQFVFNVAIEKNITDEIIINEFKTALDSFIYKVQFEKELAGKGYISDDRIV